MGPSGFEPLTPVLSGLCSNQLSYGPNLCVMFPAALISEMRDPAIAKDNIRAGKCVTCNALIHYTSRFLKAGHHTIHDKSGAINSC